VRTALCQAADLGLVADPKPPAVAPTPRAKIAKPAQNGTAPEHQPQP
jgi:hypothetical protein